MYVDMKLMFGVRTSDTVTFTVTGKPGPQAPALLIRTRGSDNDVVIPYQSGAWIATLAAGDHVVRIEAPGDRWFEGDVSFTLSAASVIVIPGDDGSPKPTAWPAPGDTVEAINNPKNPWPPPRLAESPPDQAWFSKTLDELKATISPARCLQLPQHHIAQ